jgi:hypothetical protein
LPRSRPSVKNGAVGIGLKPLQSWPSAANDSHLRAQKITF